jgi:hypothetical protein
MSTNLILGFSGGAGQNRSGIFCTSLGAQEKPHIPERISIKERPKAVLKRLVIGHWETDTISCRKSYQAVQVTVERKARYAKLAKLKTKTARAMSTALARRLMEETEVYRMVQGYGRKRPADLRQLAQILVSFSNLIVDFPEIAEVDIHPLAISNGKAFALSARIIIDKDSLDDTSPYPHLVITPYPTRYVTPWTLSEELNSAREHYLDKERCLFCDMIKEEISVKKG